YTTLFRSLAVAADRAVGQSAWRLCPRPDAGGADRARCGRERRCGVAEIVGAALGGIRAGRAGCSVLHALWLEFAAGVEKNPDAGQRIVAGHGMAAGRF